MSANRLIPAYYDGDDRSGAPVFLKTSSEIKELRRHGLEGWYRSNGTEFVIYRKSREVTLAEIERSIIASTMRIAWYTRQSGYAGPLVMQMRSERGVAEQ